MDDNYYISNNDYDDYSLCNGPRTRRKRTDVVGRDYHCDQCANAYFSSAALYTHKKLKHFGQPIITRVRKPYFEEEEGTKQKQNLPDSEFNVVFQELRNFLSSNKKTNYRFRNFEFKQDELYKAVIKRVNARESDPDFAIDVFAEYLVEQKGKTNSSGYAALVKVLFFLIDSINRDNEGNFKNYVTVQEPDEIPLFVNDFLAFYVREEGIKEILDLDDAARIAFEFCRWLFVREYTDYTLMEKEIR